MGGGRSGEHERFDAAVTGLGMMTPAGTGTAASWERIREGAGTEAARMPELEGITTDFACQVPGFDPVAVLGRRRAGQFDRSSQLVLAAAVEAVADSGLDPQTWDGARVGVVLGNGIGGAATWETQHRRLLDSGPRRVSPAHTDAVGQHGRRVRVDGVRRPRPVTGDGDGVRLGHDRHRHRP